MGASQGLNLLGICRHRLIRREPYLDWSHPFYWFWWGTQVFLALQTLTHKIGTDSCTLVQECDSD